MKTLRVSLQRLVSCGYTKTEIRKLITESFGVIDNNYRFKKQSEKDAHSIGMHSGILFNYLKDANTHIRLAKDDATKSISNPLENSECSMFHSLGAIYSVKNWVDSAIRDLQKISEALNKLIEASEKGRYELDKFYHVEEASSIWFKW